MTTSRCWPVLAVVLLLSGCSGCGSGDPAAVTPAATPVKLTVLHFNDFHAAWRPIGHVSAAGELDGEWSGAATIAARLKKFRAADPNCLVLFGGDMFLANPIDSRTQGASTVKLMNLLKPDAACLGNHEFDYGRARLEELMAKLQYPLLAANVTDAGGGNLFKASVVIEKNGLRILVVGLFPVSGRRYYEEDHDLKISEALAAVKKAVAAATGDHDLTIVLSHLGRDEDEQLAKALPAALGVDLIVGAHTHEAIESIDRALPIPVVQAGANGEYLGRLELEVDAERNCLAKMAEYELLPTLTAGITPDPAVQAMLKTELAAIAPMLAPVAELADPLTFSRTEECRLGNFVADAFADMFDAEIAVADSKWLRRYLAGPEISGCDVREVLPGGMTLCRVKIPGSGLRSTLEYYLKQDDRFISVSEGMRCTMRGGRLTAVTVNGQPLAGDRLYTVIAEQNLAGNMERHNGGEIIGTVSTDAAAAMIAWLKKQARPLTAPELGRVTMSRPGGARREAA